MTHRRDSSKVLLIVAGAGLVLLTVALLFALRDANAPAPPPAASPEPVRVRPSTPAPIPAAVERPDEPPKSAAQPAAPAPPPTRRLAVPTPGPTPTRESPLSERHTRAMAPAAVPAEIEQETDPRRKMQLVKMHQLATERVRVGMLQRRIRLLNDTIRDTTDESTKSAHKRDLEELRKAMSESEERLKELMLKVATGGTPNNPSITIVDP